MGASSDMGQPFRPRQKSWGLGWEESRLSRYDIRAEGALPPSMIARVGYNIYVCELAQIWFISIVK